MTNFIAAALAVLNPVGKMPIFLDFTRDQQPAVRRRVAMLVTSVSTVILMAFLFTGQELLSLFGITMPAFRIAGGILLFLIGLSMIEGRVQSSGSFDDEPGEDVTPMRRAKIRFRHAFVPLGMPMLLGPGSISTMILYAGRAQSWTMTLAMGGVVLALMLTVLISLATADRFEKWAGRTSLTVATRIMGLLLAAIAAQFVLDGLAHSTVGLIDPAIVSSPAPTTQPSGG